MRTCIAGNGSDATAALVAYLKANRQLLCADLFQLQTYVQGEAWSQNVLLTNFDQPLSWSPVGTFIPGRISRGTIESKIGLDVSSLDLDWHLRSSDVFYSPAGQPPVTMLQSFQRGLWDNGRVTIYRTVMPTLGDCNTYGAMTMFSGRVAETTMTRTGVKLKVNALSELFDLQVPTNTIEPTNVMSQYGVGQPPAGMSTAPTFQVTSAPSMSEIIGTCTAPNNGQVFAADTFDFGYIQFNSGTSLGKIRRSVWFFSGSGAFYLYDPLPWLPQIGESFTAYIPFARSSTQLISNEPHTIPGNIPPGQLPTLVVNQSPWVSDAGVTYANGQALTLVGASPGQGQYSVALNTDGVTATYTFGTPDENQQVLISYRVRTAGGYMGFPYVPAPEQSA
jgi:hypothetical protein